MGAAGPIRYISLHDEREAPARVFTLEGFTDWTFRRSADDLPHRHDFQELIFYRSGSARHWIDGQLYELAGPAVVLIARGEVHSYERATALTGYLLRFTDDFLPGEPPGSPWEYGVTPFERGRKEILSLTADEERDLRMLFGLMEREWLEGDERRWEALRHLLAVLLIRVRRLAGAVPNGTVRGEAERLYRAFAALLERDYAAHRDVQHYADALGETPSALARALREVMGRSTKQCIDERVILEARRYLLYTEQAVKEIAEMLGYLDPFQFSKTFKRLTGEAPAAYRAARRKVT